MEFGLMMTVALALLLGISACDDSGGTTTQSSLFSEESTSTASTTTDSTISDSTTTDSSDTATETGTTTVAPGVVFGALSGNTSEDGQTGTFTLKLKTAPTDNVIINLTSSDAGEGVVEPPSIFTFTSSNWEQPQTAMIKGVNDFEFDGNIVYDINFFLTSTDSTYNGLAVPVLAVSNNENDLGSGTSSDPYTLQAGGIYAGSNILAAEEIFAVISGLQPSTVASIIIDNTIEDLDLYYYQSDNTFTTWTCRPFTYQGTEACVVNTPSGGPVYLKIHNASSNDSAFDLRGMAGFERTLNVVKYDPLAFLEFEPSFDGSTVSLEISMSNNTSDNAYFQMWDGVGGGGTTRTVNGAAFTDSCDINYSGAPAGVATCTFNLSGGTSPYSIWGYTGGSSSLNDLNITIRMILP